MEEKFTDAQIDSLLEVLNLAMSSAASALGTLMGKTVNITSPDAAEMSTEDIKNELTVSCVIIDFPFEGGLEGNSVLIFKERELAVLNNLLNELGPEDGLLDLGDNLADTHMEEALNKMLSFAASAMSETFSEMVTVKPAHMERLVPAEQDFIAPSLQGVDTVLEVTYRIKAEEYVDSNIRQLIPMDLAEKMLALLGYEVEAEEGGAEEAAAQEFEGFSAEEEAPQPEEGEEPPAELQPEEEEEAEEVEPEPEPEHEPEPLTPEGEAEGEMPEEELVPQSEDDIEAEVFEDVFDLSDFLERALEGVPEERKEEDNGRILWSYEEEADDLEALSLEERMEKLNLVRDIPIELTVVLGENKMKLGDLMESGIGSMVPLDRLAGEPVDILVNEQLVARGEVVVVDGKIGVRVLSIESKLPKASLTPGHA